MELQAEGVSRRKYTRVTGPFEGRIASAPTPILVYDLSLGGGFVNFEDQQPTEPTLLLNIALPDDGWITVKAETVYRHLSGIAVKFVELDSETVRRLARTVEALTGRAALN
jgi:hypothetical protein